MIAPNTLRLIGISSERKLIGQLCLPYVHHENQVVDALTKGLTREAFTFALGKVSTMDIYAQLEGKC